MFFEFFFGKESIKAFLRVAEIWLIMVSDEKSCLAALVFFQFHIYIYIGTWIFQRVLNG